MIVLSKFVANLDVSEKQLRLLLNSLPPEDCRVPNTEDELTLSGTLAVLIFDFLMVVGKRVEEVQPVVVSVFKSVHAYCLALEAALDVNTEELPHIPTAFLSLLDNRFISVSGHSVSWEGLYDIETGDKVAKLPAPPVCSLGLCLPALYLNSVAAFTRHQPVAEAFKSGQITMPQC